ncbi:WD40 repeat domain-containing protein [Streptomyces niveus]|uniref:WD40 repeat domain-containing protein n=1 Tax=Streptomyces niveus TaxID=193462 RepID=UPI0036BDA9E7
MVKVKVMCPSPRPGPRPARVRSALAAAVLALAGAAGALAGPAAMAAPAAPTAPTADPDRSFRITDPRITESSGLAASRAHPGVYWTHNDQDKPLIYGVDSRTGETVATITMRGVGEPRDMEAISVGADGDIYVGDIGDNLNGSWDHVWIYRFPEPKTLADATVDATQYDVKYADGPRDAEALMVHPTTGRVYIASKNENGGGLYEGPAELTADGTNTFTRIDEVPWVTDGAFSPDGKELLLRSYFSARAYVWKNGRLGADKRVRAPIQGQAESVTYTLDGSALMFGTEGTRSQVERVDIEKDGGSSGGAGSTGDGAAGDGADGESGNITIGAVVLVGVAVLYIGFKRRKQSG